MDALVKVPYPSIGEEETGARESHILESRGTCCLDKIRAVGEPLGISCQQVFERAYLRAGHEGTFARAVFAMYLGFKGMGPMPKPVQHYLELVAEKGYEERGGKEGFCAGCMFDRVGINGFVAAYELICPVTLQNSNSIGTGTLSTVDEHYLDLLDSGALSQENEGWQDVLDANFEIPEE